MNRRILKETTVANFIGSMKNHYLTDLAVRHIRQDI